MFTAATKFSEITVFLNFFSHLHAVVNMTLQVTK